MPNDDPRRPFRSPPSLLETGPYGRAPLLITGPRDGNRQIPESAAIATYLIRTFDTSDKFGLRNGDWIRDEVLCSMTLTNLTRAQGFMMYIDFGVIQNGTGPGAGRMDGPEIRSILGDLERELKEGPKGGFFMGENPGRADILMEFPMSMVKHRNYVDLEKEFSALDGWLKRVYDRPAFKRCLEKGNGYDFSKLPNPRKL
jgi:glutathione S-transferase